MAKRITIDPSQVAPQPSVSPAASPVNTYYTPRLAAPQLMAVTDLSGLSESLAKVSLSQKAMDNEKDQTLIQQFLGSPEEQSRLQGVVQGLGEVKDATAAREKLIKASADAVRGKGLPFENSPWLPVLYQQAGAQFVMQSYREKLLGRIGEVSAVMDPNTHMPADPKSADQIVADTWKEFGSNPALSGFYGAKIQNDLKGQAEAAFHSAASEKLGQAKASAYKLWAGSEVTRAFKDMAAKSGGMSDMDKAATQMFLEQTFHRYGLSPVDVAATVTDAADAAVAFVSKGGPDDGTNARQAAAWLEDLKTVKYGNQTLGDVAPIGEYADKRQAALLDKAESNAVSWDEKVGRQRSNAREGAYADLLTWKHDPQHPERAAMDSAEAFESWSTGVRGDPALAKKWGPANVEAAIESARQNSAHAQSITFRDESKIGTLELLAQNVQDHDNYVAVVRGFGVPEADQARLIAKHEEISNVRRRLADIPEYAQTSQGLSQTISVRFQRLAATENGQELYDGARAIQDAWEKSITTFAKTHNPAETEAEVSRTATAVTKEVQAYSRTAVQETATARADIDDRISRHLDATDLIKRNAKYLSDDQLERYRDENTKSSDPYLFARTFYQGGAAYNQIAERLKLANEGTEPQQDVVEQAAKSARAKAEDWLHGQLTSPAYRPAAIMDSFNVKASEFAVEAADAQGGNALPKVTATTTPGQASAGAAEISAASRAARLAAMKFDAGDRKGAATEFLSWYSELPENGSNTEMLRAANKLVLNTGRPDYKDYRAGFEDALGAAVSGAHQGFWGGYTDNAAEGITPEVVAQRAVNGLAVLGMSVDEIIAKKVTVPAASAETKARYLAEIQQIEKPVYEVYSDQSVSAASFNADRLKVLRALTTDTVVDISKAKIPFTAAIKGLDTPEKVDAFANTPRAAQLMEAMGLTGDAGTIKKWADLRKTTLRMLP